MPGVAEAIVIVAVICGFLFIRHRLTPAQRRTFVRRVFLAFAAMSLIALGALVLLKGRSVELNKAEYVDLAEEAVFGTRLADLAASRAPAASALPSGVDRSEMNPEMLWVPITRDMLTQFMLETTEDEEAPLVSEFPIGLTQAYRLMPLPPSSGGAATPMIRQALSPAAMQLLLTRRNLRALANSVASMLPKAADDASAQNNLVAEASETNSTAHELAEWVNESPGLGQFVISSRFAEATTPPETALRPAITEAFESHITHLCSRDFGIGDGWKKLMDVTVSDRVVRQSIVKTDRKVEVLDTVDGEKMMQQTFALIEFPAAVETEVLSLVRKELVRSRTAAICIVLIAIWLSGVLLTIALRASQGGSLLQKLATVPAMVILVLPCLLIVVAMISGMASGETFDLRFGGNRVVCEVDAESR